MYSQAIRYILFTHCIYRRDIFVVGKQSFYLFAQDKTSDVSQYYPPRHGNWIDAILCTLWSTRRLFVAMVDICVAYYWPLESLGTVMISGLFQYHAKSLIERFHKVSHPWHAMLQCSDQFIFGILLDDCILRIRNSKSESCGFPNFAHSMRTERIPRISISMEYIAHWCLQKNNITKTTRSNMKWCGKFNEYYKNKPRNPLFIIEKFWLSMEKW